jgi:hypothetical protein
MKARGELKLRSNANARFTQLLIPWTIFLIALWGTTVGFSYLQTIEESIADISCSPSGSIRAPPYATTTSTRAVFELYSGDFFTINLGFGNFSYAAAKAIDIAWDLIAGRGGQALLIYLTWDILRSATQLTMEVASLDFPTFTAVVFDRTSVWSLWTMLRCSGRKIRSTRAGAALLLSAAICLLYILAWPTILAAMSGYLAPYQAFVELPSRITLTQTYVNASQLVKARMTVQDGERVGLVHNYGMANEDSPNFDAFNQCKSCSPNAHSRVKFDHVGRQELFVVVLGP